MTFQALNIEEVCVFTARDVHFVAFPVENLQQDFGDKVLATLVTVPSDVELFQEYILKHVEASMQRDDVFCIEFLSGIIIRTENRSPDRTGCRSFSAPRTWNTLWVRYIDISECPTLLPGPYLLSSGRYWDPLRIYNDSINAFMSTFRSNPQSKPSAFVFQGSRHASKGIAVPSRLRARKSPDLPLSGVRFAVKDMFEIEGSKRSLGSRAYLELYPPASRIAPAIQMLIDKGALLLGTTKLCSMVGTTEPTQCIDFSAPFNPRADGYQSPSGGSNGQPAAIAAYDWLDFAVGSDSTVSGRMPAQANGCFSLRPSLGVVSREGMWSGAPNFDTPCLFARSLENLKLAARVWYDDSLASAQISSDIKPTSLIFPTDHLPDNQEQMDIFETFVKDLERHLDVRAERISIQSEWIRNRPAAAGVLSLAEWLNKDIASRTYIYSFWKQIEKFHDDYMMQYSRPPYMPPPHGINLWDRAKNVTLEQHLEGLDRLRVYKKWLQDKVLKNEIRRTILVMPLKEIQPNYRDEWPR